MYIVKKKIRGREYYYLRESKREKDKVKSVTIAYLGKNRKEAEKRMKEIMRKLEKPKEKPEEKEKKEEKAKEEKQKKIEISKEISIDDLATFCKRKGFVYLSSEIYGGFAGFWDYGPLGTELKNNIKQQWWKFFVQSRDDVIGIDGSIITHPKVWEASGHAQGFNDILVICKKCKKANKVDKNKLDKATCEFCNGELDKESAKELNVMLTTRIGPIEKDSTLTYLRPETAQTIFTNFKQVAENSRLKLPFGIAQIGKAFRNEIAPRDFLFRSREFEQMEIEYFIFPKEKCKYKIPDVKVLVYSATDQEKNKEAEEMKIKSALDKKIIKRDWHAYWLALCLLWFKNLNCNLKNFRIRQHPKFELAHYSTDCWDLEYKFPFGWKELLGIADRGDYDLRRHEKFSGKDLKLFVEGKGKILPHVVAEPSFGVDRAFLVFMLEAYAYDRERENIVLKLPFELSPIKAAVFPIVKNAKMEKLARKVYLDLKKEFNVIYDVSGSIGRRYSRNDEISTPFCITIDDKSLKNKDVTIRERDTTKQIRVKIFNLIDILRNLIFGKIKFEKAGRLVETRKK